MKNLILVSLLALAACGPADDFGNTGGGGGGITRPPLGGGSAGGGGGSSTTSCSSGSSCKAFSCTCADSTVINSAQYCFNGSCQAQAATCTNACRSHTSTPTTPSNTTSLVYGCTISRYSSDKSVTAILYGSSSARGTALDDAQSQCSRADWASWFCTGSTESCVSEDAVAYSCTFSKYSSQYSSTIHFHGSGLGPTAAKADAVDACLASGQWQGWFCSSGSLSCTRD